MAHPFLLLVGAEVARLFEFLEWGLLPPLGAAASPLAEELLLFGLLERLFSLLGGVNECRRL